MVEVAQQPVVTRLLYPGFWEGKVPCWEMLGCPQAIREICPATRHPDRPCWEIEGTYNKLVRRGGAVTGCDTSVCKVCRVYRRWGNSEPITIRHFGEGINRAPCALEAVKEKCGSI